MSSNTNPSENRVAALRKFGQSIWLDFIRRSLLKSGELRRRVDEDALGGLTSNPAIFEKAIQGSNDYRTALQELARGPRLPAKRVFELLAIRDIQDAADVFHPVYESSHAHDGYVSLEVAPDLADDTQGTLEEARRLWREVQRPNLMIKVPGTRAGLPAVRALLAEGINVNITLLFARSVYEQVAQTFIEALEERASRGLELTKIASVASFFVSRIDTSVDALLAAKLNGAAGDVQRELGSLQGRVAIANAKLAYQSYKQIFGSSRFAALRAKGAQTQRVLWASTGTKNPQYSDVLYVEELIGPDTVNTVPPETLSAFREHGRARATLESDLAGARSVLERLERAGISLEQVTDELLADGLNKFVEPFNKVLQAVEQRLAETVQ